MKNLKLKTQLAAAALVCGVSSTSFAEVTIETCQIAADLASAAIIDPSIEYSAVKLPKKKGRSAWEGWDTPDDELTYTMDKVVDYLALAQDISTTENLGKAAFTNQKYLTIVGDYLTKGIVDQEDWGALDGAGREVEGCINILLGN